MRKDKGSPAAEEETPQVEATETQEQAVPSELELAVARGVDAWFAACIRDTDVARQTAAYNHLQSVKGQLATFVAKELEQ